MIAGVRTGLCSGAACVGEGATRACGSDGGLGGAAWVGEMLGASGGGVTGGGVEVVDVDEEDDVEELVLVPD